MNFRPLGDRVLVRISEAQSVSSGGIYIPTTAQEKPQEGVVVSVGQGRVTEGGKLVEPRVKRDDKVLLPKYTGTEIKLDGVAHLVISEEEILGILE